MKRILYFTDDFSKENQEFAKSHSMTIRNINVSEGDFVEECQSVYVKNGEVPTKYKEKPLHIIAKATKTKSTKTEVK